MAQLENAVRAYLMALIKQSGIKQEAIAEAAGKTQSWLSNYKSGSRGSRMTLDDLDALAQVFDKTLADVLVEVGDKKQPALAALERWTLIGRVLLKAGMMEQFEPTLDAYVKAAKAAARPRRKPSGNTE